MKNKIAFKLTTYFSITLLLFSIIIGSLFMTLFKKHTVELHKTDLEKRSLTISDTLSQLINAENSQSGMGMILTNEVPQMGMGMMNGKQSGYGAYLRFLDDIAMTDLWIVDENLELITIGKMTSHQYNYSDLPEDAEVVVKEVFKGTTNFSEGFSNLLNTPTLTVGTPIKVEGKIIGALLLHSKVEGMNEAINQGFNILSISILAALILSILLSIILAVSFTKPLKKIKSSAIQLAKGDYSSKTNVKQIDEIGDLASTIDILSEQLEFANYESQKLLKLRQDFVANISHELRTPVTVIRGSLEALCDGIITDPKQVKSYNHQMLNESIFLQRLVNDLLDLSRLQNIDFKIEKQELNLLDVLNDVVRSTKNIAKLKDIKIVSEQDKQVFTILGDYGRIRQMFLTILDNAIKFSPEGGVIKISLKDKTISIKDNGVGISKDDLPYIFDRFYKVKSEENKNGTGLGLAIAKQIAERHNIDLSVSSEENKFTEFKFTF